MRSPGHPFAGLPREVAVLTAVAFAVAVGFGVVAPAIPVYAREFGVGRTAAGAVISAFAFMRLVSALGSGRLVNRIGERLVLAVGIGIVAVSSALAGLAQSYTQLLLLRGVGGIGSAMFTVSAISLLLRVVDADQRGRATGMWQSGFLIGAIAGPAIGGPLTEISLRAPFFVYAVTLAVAGSIGLGFLSRAALHDVDEDDPGRGHGHPAASAARLRLPRGPDGQPGQRVGPVRRTELTDPALRDRGHRGLRDVDRHRVLRLGCRAGRPAAVGRRRSPTGSADARR